MQARKLRSECDSKDLPLCEVSCRLLVKLDPTQAGPGTPVGAKLAWFWSCEDTEHPLKVRATCKHPNDSELHGDAQELQSACMCHVWSRSDPKFYMDRGEAHALPPMGPK